MEDEMYEPTNTIYIKSNTATVMRFLTFLSVVLFAIVGGLCSYIIFTYKYDENYHFDKSKQFYFTVGNDTATINKFMDNTAEICEIPNYVTYNGRRYSVTAIGENAFTNHHYLTEVKIPDTVTTIMGNAENQTGAFSGCTALATVHMGKSVDSIGEYAFKNCIALTSIDIPASVQFVKEGAFLNCYNLETVRLNGKVTLKKGSFSNCIGVRTLKLDAEAELNDQTREALTDLTGLNQFRILGEGSIYKVNDDGNCLLIETNASSLIKDYTLVLGGRGANVPDDVTNILDWAWGKRAADNLYVSIRVKNVGEFAFDNQSICTNAPFRPQEWLTTVTVYTNARPIDFVAKGKIAGENGTEHRRMAYVYDHPDYGVVKPDYLDLFADLESETPFVDWDEISGTTCYAKYEDDTIGTLAKVEVFESERNRAKRYIEAVDTRAKLTIDFWEKFKSAYYRAEKIEDPNTEYDYLLTQIYDVLHDLNEQIYQAIDKSNDPEGILESAKWEIGLQNLVDAVEELSPFDLMDSTAEINPASLIETINIRTKEAKDFLAGGTYVMAPEDTWRELREAFEKLIVDVTPEGLLGSLIADCQTLDRHNYTNESWANLQTCLAAALQITEHNLSISRVRRNLEQALEDLVEILPVENMVVLETWISICSDLLTTDYQDGYENRLLPDLILVTNSGGFTTSSEIEKATNLLKTDYRYLVLVKNPTQTNPGIFNMRTIPFFILAAILFTGAVVAGAEAVYLKRQLRRVS